jgi:plastocyanin
MQKRGMRTLGIFGALLLPVGIGLVGTVHAKAAKAFHRQAVDTSATSTGEIAGKVDFKGEKPKLEPIDMKTDPVCVSEQAGTVYVQDGEVNSNGTLPSAFVYIKSGSGNLSVPAPHNSVVLTQQGCMYQPHVLGIVAGQPLQVVTLDPTTHNVHVMPKINREWNVTQQPGSPSIIKAFTQPEAMIPVHCNVHPWMKAYIGVVSNPYYAVTDNQGSFVIKGVPPGEYTLEVWTAIFGTQEQRVTVRPGESSTINFTVEAH